MTNTAEGLLLQGGLRWTPIRDRIRDRIIETAVARGANKETVTKIVNDLETDRPLLDWLMNGGFEALMKFIMSLMLLFNEQGMNAAAWTPIRDRIRQLLVLDAVARGADEAAVVKVVAELESDRPLLDWLLNGGFDKLLKMIMELVGMSK